MTRCDWDKKLLIGIIIFFITGSIFTRSVKGEEKDTDVLVTPLSTVSIYQQPKYPESDQNELTAVPLVPPIGSEDNTPENVTPMPFPEEDIVFDKVCEPTDLKVGEEMFCTVTITNNGEEDFSYKLLDYISRRLTILEDTIEGGHLFGEHVIIHRGTLMGGVLPSVSIEKADTSLAYNSLRDLGIPPLTDVQDEAMVNVATLEPFIYGGEEYTTLGIASNGYLIPGLGSDEDIAYIPQTFPDPAIPNNVIAPFWTDLNPEAGGNIYAALLTRDEISWVVIEWEDVPAFNSEKPAPNCVDDCGGQYTFQVWIKTNTTEQDVTFVYERVDGEGAASGLNIGVEDIDGTEGANYDSVPTALDELIVTTTPGMEGETHVISYTAQAEKRGHWYGCALLKVYHVRGVTFDCVYGTITK